MANVDLHECVGGARIDEMFLKFEA